MVGSQLVDSSWSRLYAEQIVCAFGSASDSPEPGERGETAGQWLQARECRALPALRDLK